MASEEHEFPLTQVSLPTYPASRPQLTVNWPPQVLATQLPVEHRPPARTKAIRGMASEEREFPLTQVSLPIYPASCPQLTVNWPPQVLATQLEHRPLARTKAIRGMASEELEFPLTQVSLPTYPASRPQLTVNWPPQVEPLRCQVSLGDLMDSYLRIAEKAGVMPLPDENDVSVFRPSQPVPQRKKWDAGLGSSWSAIRKGGREGGSGVEAQRGGEDVGVEEAEEGAAETTGKKRKQPRGPGSKRSRKRSGKDLRLAGSNAAARKVRISDKWAREGTSYQTSSYSLLEDGSHTSTGWQGLAPPVQKRKEVMRAYKNGSITQALGSFFPVPYEP
jgi:hypothetical protein